MTPERTCRFESATPVLKTGDYPRARAFYSDRLGFSVVEEGGDPARFGIFRRGGAMVFVDGWNGPPPNTGTGWDAYVHVQGLDVLCDELSAAGVEIMRGPVETEYRMREIDVRDPDGNIICFGQDLDPQ